MIFEKNNEKPASIYLTLSCKDTKALKFYIKLLLSFCNFVALRQQSNDSRRKCGV